MYYTSSIHDALDKLESSENGLSKTEAKKRLEKEGKNTLPKKKASQLKIFFSQFNNFLVYILIFALIVSIIIPVVEKGGKLEVSEFIDAFAIGAILLVNALLSYFQERKAQHAVELLSKLFSPTTVVMRNNKKTRISSEDIVPGDVVIVEAGSKISADGRILELKEFAVNEASLTGESNPVKKTIKVLTGKRALGDQTNLVFSGTIVTSGNAKFVVTATGTKTQVGQIAKMVQTTKSPETPLQKRLDRLGKIIGTSMMLVAIFVFMIGMFQEIPIGLMLLFAISLAVAAVPEGLPAVVTVTLALSISRLVKKNILVKKIKSVETLGSVNVICSDKTGTITENKMFVTKVFTNNKLSEAKDIKKTNSKRLLQLCSSCNNASLPNVGDPTDIALLRFADERKVSSLPRTGEIPFTSERKFMQTDHEIEDKTVSFIKSAPEKFIGEIDAQCIDGSIKPVNSKQKNELLKINDELASNALRVLAVGFKEDGKTVFLGLIGLMDPPRPGVKKAIQKCCDAGIRTIMVTGDHASTARAIAKQVGLPPETIQGKELDKLTDKQLNKTVKTVSVYARVSPKHKVRILTALQKNDSVVAMTGDGVNDAPALKKADVGVAMGITGTDVAKDTSDLVITDDNFSTIVSAVEQGRIIYDNIKKFIRFLFAANAGEVFIVLAALLLTLPLPFLPLHILWVNLVTDSLPALALSVEKGSKNIMRRKPNKTKHSILNGSVSTIITAGFVSMIAVLGLFYSLIGDLELARTVALTTLILFELFIVFSIKSEESIFKTNPFSNKWLIGAVFVSLFAHLIVLYTPLNEVFKLVPLTLDIWLKIIPVALSGLIVLEIKKLIFRKNSV